MPPTSGSSSIGDRSRAVPSASTPRSPPFLSCLSPHRRSSSYSQDLLRCESMSPPATTTVGGLSPPWTKVSPLLPLPSFCFVQFMYYEGCCSRSRNVSTVIRAAACSYGLDFVVGLFMYPSNVREAGSFLASKF
jgi:hypothetical protein